MRRGPLGAALVGVAGGSAVVVSTLALEALARGLPVRGGLLALQLDSVAIWVVEALPIVVGVAAWAIAARSERVVEAAPAPPAPAPTAAPPAPPSPSSSPSPAPSASPSPASSSAPPPPPVPQALQAANLLGKAGADVRVKALQELLRAVKEQAERATIESRAKSRYLANMSHELRTPLNAIIGYAEMLHEEAADQRLDLAGDLQKVASAGRQLVELINHVLDLSKIEVGQLAVVLEDVDLAQVAEEVRIAVTPLVSVNGNAFSIRIARGARMVRGDHMRIRQVLVNLLGNAFKFTTRGSVTLTIERTTPKRDAWIALRVKDTGIGMTEEQKERVFDEYAQVEARVERPQAGTGLGLAISRKLTELMGGRIEVVSEPGMGSTFSVILPPSRTPEEQVAPRSTIALNERLAGMELLLVDADPGGITLARYLEKAGLDVKHVTDVASARIAWGAEDPKIVVADAALAGGWSLIEDLVRDGVKVVAVSIEDGDVETALQVGVTAFLVRPLDKKLVLATLERCLDDA